MNTNKVDWAAEVQSAVLAMKEEGQKAYTFMKTEAPEVGAEYVRWKLTESTISSAALILASILLVVVAEKLRRAGKINKPEYGGDNFYYVACTIMFAGSAWATAEAVSLALSATKCLIAPRLIIIEGIKEVVR